MKTFSLLGTVVPLMFLLTSCFEWHEQMQLHQDGSGTYRITLDMSNSKSILDTAQQYRPDSAQEALFRQQVHTAFEQGALQLNEIEGISQTRALPQDEAYQFGLHFRFASLAALNQALSFLAKVEKPVVFFQKDRKDLLRKGIFPFRELVTMPHPEQSEAEAQTSGQLRSDLIEKAYYVFSLHAPEQRIKRFANPRATQQGQTHLTLRLPLRQVLEDQSMLEQEVRIK